MDSRVEGMLADWRLLEIMLGYTELVVNDALVLSVIIWVVRKDTTKTLLKVQRALVRTHFWTHNVYNVFLCMGGGSTVTILRSQNGMLPRWSTLR